MESLYLGLVIFLLLLAVFDLVVGVSNDAVNFLNSAVGAKVATLRTIMIVAGIGIFLGATTSSGMMEIARNGIMHPSMFSFREVIFIFVAVMISDVVLLNIFNSLGLPTSTTVSMVFELLGGTAAIAMLKIAASNGALRISDLMNTDKAFEIIGAIFISVGIAFVFGVILQWLARLVFTFAYKNGLKWKIGIFGGLATTTILYFMVFKSMKNFSFIRPEVMEYINTNIGLLLLYCFIGSTILMQILYFLKVNVFKVLVLMGTFALAMAFAGNDLVNFIGVPLAGLSSYKDFIANGSGDAASHMMTALNGPAKTPFLYLAGAGLIMAIALATSKKAHNVIKTSVDLSRQNEGDEMFGNSKIARVLVRASNNAGRFFSDAIPDKVKAWVAKRFDTREIHLEHGAAFDEVRATVSLVIASLLIALGTSLTLPLSTTYVTFMVAMGTSLADKAWGRESAVYRVTGVVSVIGGWFVTAAAAFSICFVLTLIHYYGGFVGVGLMVALATYILIRTNIRYRRRKEDEQKDKIFNEMMLSTDKDEILKLLQEHVTKSQADFMNYVNTTFIQITDGFIKENLGMLHRAKESMIRKRGELKNLRRKELIGLRKLDPSVAMEKNTWFHLGRNSCEDILYCMRRIEDACEEQVDNNFSTLSQEQIKEFIPLRDTVLFLTRRAEKILERDAYEEVEEVRREEAELRRCLEETRDKQMQRMQSGKDNISAAYVYLSLLQETREITASIGRLLRASKNFREA
ncbi:MAG: inorganic phosphate transporter [Bacteroidales bacterium]|jgi:phosphate/sulfate permease|nr:inorganic phosphate transporter [Bacteroidota bacterium]NLN99070.1 inorganic phosphate transporter [Bacteroidales bacterium]